ncbi:uncharacterized protein LOC112343636 [Selaginella moellendorffii]|uniref:uncharacterized protein LOC112343636 n=1 Tax=Selaginella moellendorffii TaxID=88036 RepID=UPI000D1C2DF8|nr:uncharacterized protein LOC112343636 [Selaginella moellendorffii]|eukprot:XP_024523187.1 uncharacterized protein LOC112343636 [Selaginella moellendorffii]
MGFKLLSLPSRSRWRWRRCYSTKFVPLLRHQAEKIIDSEPPVSRFQDPALLGEAARLASLDPSEMKLVRPLKLVYIPSEEVPVLYNAGPRDAVGRVWCDSMLEILKSLGSEKKDVLWQECDDSMLSALELIGSISHIEPGTRVVSNEDRSRQFVIVDLKQKEEMCRKLELLPTDRLVTGLALCTVPRRALELGAFEPVKTSGDQVELKINETKLILQSVERHVRLRELGLQDWLNLKACAGTLVVRHCAVVDLSWLGATSNVGLFWPVRDSKFLSLVQRLLRDISIRTRGFCAQWGPFQASNIREVRIVPLEDITELERVKFVEPRWLSSREIVPRRSSLPAAAGKRTLRIREPIVGPGYRPRPRYWYRLLQVKPQDMKDSDGGHHGFREVPIHMANRKKLNRTQRIKFGLIKPRKKGQ